MSKGTSVKDAIKAWEAKNGQKSSEAEEVKLYGQLPPIEKMDGLGGLKNCRHLSLSTNSIDRIGNLSGLDRLEILSLGRNQIKNLAGLEAVSDTLQQLWISYNNIEKLTGIEKLRNLRVLYMSNNKVSSWTEFERLKQLPLLEDAIFVGNPLEKEQSEQGTWRLEVLKRLPNLKKIDGRAVSMEEREAIVEAPPEE